MKRTCKQCGKEFFLSQSEIDFYKSKNLSIPKRCKGCREANKQARGNISSSNTKLTSYTNNQSSNNTNQSSSAEVIGFPERQYRRYENDESAMRVEYMVSLANKGFDINYILVGVTR